MEKFWKKIPCNVESKSQENFWLSDAIELLKRKGSVPAECVPAMIEILLLRPKDFENFPPGLILPLFDRLYRSNFRQLLWENGILHSNFAQAFKKATGAEILADGGIGHLGADRSLANGMMGHLGHFGADRSLANGMMGHLGHLGHLGADRSPADGFGHLGADRCPGDGMGHLVFDRFLKFRFPDDLRVAEVRRLFTNTQSIHVPVVQTAGTAEAEFRDQQEKYLQSAALRQMALSFGRGAFTLGTIKPIISDPLQIPKICLSGKSGPKNQTIELPHNDAQPVVEWWPQFHNGVATGLL